MRRRARRTTSTEPTHVDPLVQECREFVKSLGLPPAASVRELRSFVEERIGQSIRIAPHETADGSQPCGMVITSGGVNYIGYDPETSHAHQDHIIAHELAHLLKGHRGVPLVSDLDSDLLATVLGRTNYDEDTEREAEIIGSLLQAHVITNPSAPQSESVDRIARTLMRRDP
ncbi:ImmA/IrrE family metallo-endopeptidase [Streptomyces sp. PBH53]|uniref:ImmA/IrrE family metallo-endopeptidase n=1 Tax=Streptomyces sp. PBH53 TaxID=1577075 RepID=UPI000ADF4BA3|nr:ImmA/IrrE family metallo-endopeptidase [Streptomyces sp. PBH53]